MNQYVNETYQEEKGLETDWVLNTCEVTIHLHITTLSTYSDASRICTYIVFKYIWNWSIYCTLSRVSSLHMHFFCTSCMHKYLFVLFYFCVMSFTLWLLVYYICISDVLLMYYLYVASVISLLLLVYYMWVSLCIIEADKVDNEVLLQQCETQACVSSRLLRHIWPWLHGRWKYEGVANRD